MEISFKHMTLSDLNMVLDWAGEEGWNPGLEDAEAFLASDPDGFFLGQADGKPVASISVANHSETFSFLGLYICKPEFRGRGIGFALWQHAMQHAGERTVGLDGVLDQQANYRKSGFVSAGSTLRFEGELIPAHDLEIRRLVSEDIPDLIELDTAANGFSKECFLQNWLEKRKSRLSVVLAPQGRISGFATIRLCGRGAKIGPVIAPDENAALRLIKAAAHAIDQSQIVVDVPETNTALISGLEQLNMQMTFQTARMYRGEPCEAGPMLQAVSTLELG